MPSLYDQIGEEALSQLVMAFYDIIETDPQVEDLHLLHLRGHGVAHSRVEQLNFLSGFLGGPQRYVRKFGHANLPRIHEHIEISPERRQLWLDCMEQAVDQVGIQTETAGKLMQVLTKVAGTIGQDVDRSEGRAQAQAPPNNKERPLDKERLTHLDPHDGGTT